MQNPIPLQFLVGLTRLIAIYFCIRGIDQLFGAAMNYLMIQSMAHPDGLQMPSALALYVTGLLIYFAIAAGVWFAAPGICRIAIPPDSQSVHDPAPMIGWNDIMIFLVGVLFVGASIMRLSNIVITLVKPPSSPLISRYNLDFADKSAAFTTVLLLCFGVVMMTRCTSIHRWIVSKRPVTNPAEAEGEQDGRGDGDKPPN